MGGGISVAMMGKWALRQLGAIELEEDAEEKKVSGGDAKKGRPGKGRKSSSAAENPFSELEEMYNESMEARRAAAVLCLIYLAAQLYGFTTHSFRISVALSNPSIMMMGRDPQTGRDVVIDDFREAYWWLRDKTPEDSRVLAWWDYGYQIAGIANRTTIADGHTWNHEHIALLGRALVSPLPEAHGIVRHLSDYVLVWSTRHGGMYGDDIAKSPHMARIAGSVYKMIDADQFYSDRETGEPSEMMRRSLVYSLVNYRLGEGVPEFPNATFHEVHLTANRLVRIYKVLNVSADSKDYCAAGRGYKAWYAGEPVRGAYPPGLREVLASKQDFAQLE